MRAFPIVTRLENALSLDLVKVPIVIVHCDSILLSVSFSLPLHCRWVIF